MWQCPECDATIEPSLDVCWNCGTSRDGSRDPEFQAADDLGPSDTAGMSQLDSAWRKSGASAVPPPVLKIRFALRTLLGVVAICAVIFAIAAWHVRPRTSDDFFRLAMVHLDSQEYPEAIADLTRALELVQHEDNPSNLPAIYAARALAYNNQGDYGNALRDISQAIELMVPPFGIPGVVPKDATGNPIFVPPETVVGWRLLRANAHVGLGEDDRAIAELNIVLQSDPTNQDALHLLAIAEGRE